MAYFTNIITLLVVLNNLYRHSDGKINIQGDVVLTGLFGIHEPNGKECSVTVDVNSVMTMEAVKWYIEKLNGLDTLPFRIGLESFETCWLDDKAAAHAVEILHRALSNETIIGVLGPETSSEAETVSNILGSVPQRQQLLQVGFSTTAVELSNDKGYPNFVRVVPNDDIQSEMMVKSMVKLDWNRIAVVYEDNVYGQDGYTRLKARVEQEGICIALTRTITINNGINANEISQILQDITVGVPNSRPPINGIILIATSSVANSVILSLDQSKYSSFPIIMFSEGTNLDGRVFKQFNGDVIAKSKGSLVLAPPYREVLEFTEHWNSIFTNASKFNLESTSNPWLLDVFYKITSCAAQDCDIRVLTNEEMKEYFSQQPLFVSYAVIAAHAMVKAAINLRPSYCLTQSNPCTGFVNNFHQGDMINAIKGMDINFQNDFSWTPDSLKNERFATDQTGEITQQDDVPSYELFNIQTPGQSKEILFEKIGFLAKDEVTIDYNKIRDYRASGEELLWPNVRKAQCIPDKICSECIPLKELQEDILHEAGDVYVVGVVPIFQKSGIKECGAISDNSGYQLAESIRFAVEKINDKIGDYSSFFPGMKIGLIIINSCMSPAVVQRKIYNLHENGIALDNGTHVDVNDKIIGYVAEYTSTVSMSVAGVLSTLKFVQISYASTSPALSDRDRFPYFMRVVTPDDAQAKAMIEIVKKLRANFIQIVYSAGAYGEDGRDKIKEAAVSNKMCVVQDIVIDDEDSSFLIYNTLRKYPKAKLVIVFLYPNHLFNVVSALTTQMKRGEFVFIGSEAWARDGEVLSKDTNKILIGSFTVSLEMYKDRELRNHAQNIKYKPQHEDPWAMMFIQAKRKCYFDLSFDKKQAEICSDTNDYSRDPDFTLDTYDTQAYVAAKCLLIGANAFLKAKCGSPVSSLCKDFTGNTKGLVEEIMKIKLELDGSGNKMKVFNGNGDGNIGYRIYNIQKDDVDQSKLTYKEIGRYPLEGTFTFEMDKIIYPNDVPINSRCPNEQVCSKCSVYPGKNGNGGLGPPKEDTKNYETLVLVLGVILGVAVIVGIILAVLLHKARKSRKDTGNDLYLRPRMQDDLSRDQATPSKIYMEIPAHHERRYVPMDSQSPL
ncbi:uncharacterized protein LOC128549591 [Mercenaria mercenaria]|uniref:uncharacterized protein LOC128549591 n=1 Tax=Mercenaria mercenaria TaxID=6596 RepID=UPI00234F3385|nr:uncharacterized protein LOC128549591 [Mercenaria mercenaria]